MVDEVQIAVLLRVLFHEFSFENNEEEQEEEQQQDAANDAANYNAAVKMEDVVKKKWKKKKDVVKYEEITPLFLMSSSVVWKSV